MKHLLKSLFFAIVACVMLSSCGARKKIVYIQGADTLQLVNTYDYATRIQKDDQLSIIVSCKEPELAAPFNMELSQRAFTSKSASVTYSNSGGSPQIYWVDGKGDINFPTIGTLHVEGMTRADLARYLQKYLIDNGYIQDPIVNVTYLNHKFSVLGEVANPGQYTMAVDRVTIFDAIAMARDLTIYGERDKIRLIREVEGKVTVSTLDLRDPNIVTSPYYYIQQNDVIYVEPNKSKASNREVSSLYSFAVSLTSLAITVATFIRTVSK